jgi:glycosyltransferase involved in cell wall biosynthesis
VNVLCLRSPSDVSPAPVVAGISSYHELALEEVIYTTSRGVRLRSALRSALGRESGADSRLAAAAAAQRADVALTIGPFLGPEYRPIFRRLPCMHVFEEDLSQMREIASQSLKGRAFRRIEVWLHGRSRWQPRIVISISTGECAAARRHYPRARHVYLPFTLDPAAWPSFSDPSGGEQLLIAGNLVEPRNAEAATAVLGELERRREHLRVPVTLVSDAGLDPAVAAFAGRDWVQRRSGAGPLWEHYRASWAALVPAFRVTGQKTTILQAWACGCPVIASRAAAQTVGAPDGALLAGADAGEIVDAVALLARRDELRGELAAAGFAALRAGFDAQRADEMLRRLIGELASDG